jgi:hypothetical protein
VSGEAVLSRIGAVLRKKIAKNRQKSRKIDVNFEVDLLMVKGLCLFFRFESVVNHSFRSLGPPKWLLAGVEAGVGVPWHGSTTGDQTEWYATSGVRSAGRAVRVIEVRHGMSMRQREEMIGKLCRD